MQISTIFFQVVFAIFKIFNIVIQTIVNDNSQYNVVQIDIFILFEIFENKKIDKFDELNIFLETSLFKYFDNFAILFKKIDRIINFKYNFKNRENKNENENEKIDIVFYYNFGNSTRIDIFENIRTIKSKRSLTFKLKKFEKNIKLFTSSIDVDKN